MRKACYEITGQAEEKNRTHGSLKEETSMVCLKKKKERLGGQTIVWGNTLNKTK